LRRFKVNPVELAIFSVVSLIVVNSLYNLLREGPPSREIASSTVGSVDLNCTQAPGTEQQTSAEKIRMTGALCGHTGAKLLKTQILNTSNRYSATVFSDEANKKFSTDYIPLNTGKNILNIEFQYSDGKTFSSAVTVNRL